MNNNIEILELFGKYENNALSAAEREVFEQKLKNDTSFKEEFEHFQLSSKLIIEAQLINLHEQIGQFHEQELAKQNRFKTYAIIAALILVSSVVAGVYYFSNDNNKVPKIKPTEIKTEVLETPISNSASIDSVLYVEIKKTEVAKSVSPKITKSSHIKPQEINDLILVSSANNKLNQTTIIPSNSTNNNTSTNQISIPKTKVISNETSARKISCDGVNIEFEIDTKSTCGDKKIGSIAIEEVNGLNTLAYNLYINDQKSLGNLYITNLDSGDYQLKIIDDNGCSSAVKNVKINTMLCNFNDVLKLSINEKWTLQAGIADKIIIIDKTDKVVYQNNQLNNGDNFVWSGTDNNNQELNAGIYFVNIFKNDNLVQKGSITISY